MKTEDLSSAEQTFSLYRFAGEGGCFRAAGEGFLFLLRLTLTLSHQWERG